MWYCPGNGGHYVGGEYDFCPEHDSRTWNIAGRLAVLAGLAFIILLAISGFWAECTVTDPEYFFYR